MAGGVCYRRFHERGAWFELKCVVAVINSKESRRADASAEREIYYSWLKDPDYQIADEENIREGRYKRLPALVRNQNLRGFPPRVDGKDLRENKGISQALENNVRQGILI